MATEKPAPGLVAPATVTGLGVDELAVLSELKSWKTTCAESFQTTT
jgi:hypothetical protein